MKKKCDKEGCETIAEENTNSDTAWRVLLLVKTNFKKKEKNKRIVYIAKYIHENFQDIINFKMISVEKQYLILKFFNKYFCEDNQLDSDIFSIFMFYSQEQYTYNSEIEMDSIKKLILTIRENVFSSKNQIQELLKNSYSK